MSELVKTRNGAISAGLCVIGAAVALGAFGCGGDDGGGAEPRDDAAAATGDTSAAGDGTDEGPTVPGEEPTGTDDEPTGGDQGTGADSSAGSTEWPARVVDNFMETCKASGANKSQCRCVLDELNEVMSLAEFEQRDAQLSAGVPPDEAIPELLAAAEDCGA